MRNIFVFVPEAPKISGPGAPTLRIGFHQFDCLANTRASAPLLVLPLAQVLVRMKNVCDP